MHLEHVNHPIIGDKVYKKNSPKINLEVLKRQALHAKYLSFTHPLTKKQVKFSVDIPEDILGLMVLAEAK